MTTQQIEATEAQKHVLRVVRDRIEKGMNDFVPRALFRHTVAFGSCCKRGWIIGNPLVGWKISDTAPSA